MQVKGSTYFVTLQLYVIFEIICIIKWNIEKITTIILYSGTLKQIAKTFTRFVKLQFIEEIMKYVNIK